MVISTKLWTSKDNDINSTKNTNRKHLHEAINKSL
jgi:aryl-alcohol dehydrogenase-like predicted oxidoreductase